MCSFLQVSSKGMKMVQTPDKSSSSSVAASKKRMLSSSDMKQFVPHRFVVISNLFIFSSLLIVYFLQQLDHVRDAGGRAQRRRRQLHRPP